MHPVFKNTEYDPIDPKNIAPKKNKICIIDRNRKNIVMCSTGWKFY